MYISRVELGYRKIIDQPEVFGLAKRNPVGFNIQGQPNPTQKNPGWARLGWQVGCFMETKDLCYKNIKYADFILILYDKIRHLSINWIIKSDKFHPIFLSICTFINNYLSVLKMLKEVNNQIQLEEKLASMTVQCNPN